MPTIFLHTLCHHYVLGTANSLVLVQSFLRCLVRLNQPAVQSRRRRCFSYLRSCTAGDDSFEESSFASVSRDMSVTVNLTRSL